MPPSWWTTPLRRSGLVSSASHEVQVLRDPRPSGGEFLHVPRDARPSRGDVLDAEGDVQEIDVPRRFHRLRDVRLDDLACDRQRRRLRVVVHVAVPGTQKLAELLDDQPPTEIERERVTL